MEAYVRGVGETPLDLHPDSSSPSGQFPIADGSFEGSIGPVPDAYADGAIVVVRAVDPAFTDCVV